jgi:ATP-dependent Clp protease ATP-binding subunit ClpC
VAGKLDRFNQRARRVLQIANEEAERLSHNYIGTEHLLLGLVKEENGIAGRVLREMGAKPERVAEMVERMTGTGRRSPSAGKLELTAKPQFTSAYSALLYSFYHSEEGAP